MTTRTNTTPRASAATDPLHDILSTLAAEIAEHVVSRLSLDGRNCKPETAKALPDFLSEADVARRTGLSRRTLQGWRQGRNGGGPPMVLAGRRVLYGREALGEWLERRSRGAGKKPGGAPVNGP